MTLSRMEGDNLVLEYDLFDLPTAQHKAGLAGLLMLARSMKERGLWKGSAPAVAATSVHFTFTIEDFQAVFDELYAAEWVEVKSRSKWKGKEPKRIETTQVDIAGKLKTDKRFVYDAVQPEGSFLVSFYQDGDGLWVKLWRDMLWNVMRSKPASRGVYEERAEGRVSSLGKSCWAGLRACAQSRMEGKVRTKDFGSSLYVGAQDENAEKVPFRGVEEEILLLHFWPVAAAVFAPRRLKIERDPQRGLVASRDDAGYVVVIPEPANLKYFVDDAIKILRSLDSRPSGYRPAAAVIDVPAEGGMEYLHYLIEAKVRASDCADTLVAMELFHLEKRGNNVRLLAAERLVPQPATITRYESVRGQWSNPLFKAVGLANLLEEAPWYRGFDAMFAEHPWQLFVYVTGQTPREIRFFGRDVFGKMKAIEADQEILRKGGVMTEEGRADQLAVRVYQLVKNYVNLKTEEKSGKNYKAFKREKGQDGKERVQYPAEYRDAREKICSDAFLGIRGRRDKEFVEYFTGTLCTVPQFLPEADFVAVAQALAGDWETVKTLSMLALSAASYLPGSVDDPKEAAQ